MAEDKGLYRDRRQDFALEMERNYAAAKQSQVRPLNQQLLSFPPFPVRHPGADHGTQYAVPFTRPNEILQGLFLKHVILEMKI